MRNCLDLKLYSDPDFELLDLLTRGLIYHDAIEEAGLEFGDIDELVNLHFDKVFPDGEETHREAIAQSLTYLLRTVYPAKYHPNMQYLEILTECSQKLCQIEVEGSTIFGWVPKNAETVDKLCLLSGAP